MKQYRLSWEQPSAHDTSAVMEAEQAKRKPPKKGKPVKRVEGKEVWPEYDWDTLHFHSVVKLSSEVLVSHAEAMVKQYRKLLAWSMSREWPVRNVRLELRDIPEPEDGWQEVEPDQILADTASK